MYMFTHKQWVVLVRNKYIFSFCFFSYKENVERLSFYSQSSVKTFFTSIIVVLSTYFAGAAVFTENAIKY